MRRLFGIHHRLSIGIIFLISVMVLGVACTGDSGATGVPGQAGVQGPPGQPGLAGPAGAQGLTGSQGPSGDQGPEGVAGLQGEIGPAGVAGPQGELGPAGVVGLQGDPGLQGIVGPPGPAGARGAEIEKAFNMVENPTFVSPITGASGTGTIVLDGRDLDDLTFEMAIEAEGLMPNTSYYLSATVREVVGGDFGMAGGNVPDAIAVVGTARTDGTGRLEFEGKGVLPNVFDSPATPGVTEWRIDQQIRQLGSGETGNCVECILVCSPTTKVKLVNGKLVQVP